MEQSKFVQPEAQQHVPLLQMPLLLQSFGHVLSSHADPAHSSSQTQKGLAHKPCPEQSDGHSFTEQSEPVQSLEHKQVPFEQRP